MMKNEFEKLAGYEVSDNDYNNILEPMYMSINASKEEFVKMVDKKRFALPTKKQILNQMKKIAQHLADTCEQYNDYKAEFELEKIAREYAKRFYNVDADNIHDYVFLNRQYTYPEIQRGCTYPCELVIGRRDFKFEVTTLV